MIEERSTGSTIKEIDGRSTGRSIKGIDDQEIDNRSGVDHICEGTINGMQKTRGSIPWYTDRQNVSFSFWLVNIKPNCICF